MANLEESPGGRAVRRWVEADSERSYRALAEAVGVTTQSLYEWRFAISNPEPSRRELIEAATGIDVAVWATRAERAGALAHGRRLDKIRKHAAKVSALTGPRKPHARSAPCQTAAKPHGKRAASAAPTREPGASAKLRSNGRSASRSAS